VYQLNKDGKRTGNNINFHFKGEEIYCIEVFNENDIEEQLISEKEAILIAYSQLDTIVEDINMVLDDTRYSEVTGKTYFGLTSNLSTNVT